MQVKIKPPRTMYVTISEGGEWIPFSRFRTMDYGQTVHAIKFKNGSIWDAYNGWRNEDVDK